MCDISSRGVEYRTCTMNGGKECEGGDREGPPPTVQVPIGWHREAGSRGVIYISPSGSMMSCLEQVKTYLLTDGTCKCGLECPLVLHKVFNFDPGAAVRQRTAEDAKADEDVTKLCIHKRKIIAVATLHKSMEAPHPAMVLTSPGGGISATPVGPTRPATPRAIRNKLQDGLCSSMINDCQNPFKAILAGQRPYQQNVSVAQKADLYTGRPRQRLASGDQGPKSPYRTGGHGVLLSPPSSGSLAYGDASLSPRSEPMGSPDAFVRVHSGPGSAHSSRRTPLSPPSALHHSSSAPQPSCAMVGRTNMPLSPTLTAKSPVMKKPMCSFPPGMDMSRSGYHHKPPPPPPPSLPPPCILQKKQVTSEKDPLGILDPIPSKPVSQGPMAMDPPSFQPSVHSQVPMMNVNIPPAIVPLPSNLPLPMVKPGPVSHGGHPQRLQHAAPTSLSSSPVVSPVHMTGPAMARVEASPQRSRSSSSSSDHGSFIVPPGSAQAPCGSLKAPSRSPRSSIGSPRPSIPSSPSAKPDMHHPSKEHPSQLLTGVSSVLGGPHGSMFPPGSGASVPQKAHPGLLGMPLNHILNQHNAASFPASSLLSAAAKAQLANQNKLTGSGAGVGGGVGSHPAGAGQEGHGAPFASGTTPTGAAEVQSGRAALRDKLMAQQRDPLRKRKQADANPGGAPMAFGSGPLSHMGPPEQPRKTARAGGLHPTTSMAELLQSISCQSSLAGPRPLRYGDGAAPPGPALHRLQVPPQLHGPREGPLGPAMDSRAPQGRVQGLHAPFSGVMSQVQASSVGCRVPHGHTRLLRNHLQSHPMLGNSPLGHATPHIQQLTHHQHHQGQKQGHPLCKDRVLTASIANGDMCMPATSEHGDSTTQMCGLGSPQLMGLHNLPHNGHMVMQPSRAPQGPHRGPAFQGPRHFPDNPYPDRTPSNPMACLFQNFQAGMAESLPVPNRQLSAQSEMSLTEHPRTPPFPPPFLEGPSGLQTEASRQESMDAVYRAVVEAAGKGVSAEMGAKSSPAPITTLSATSTFAREQVSGVARGQHPSCQEPECRAHAARVGRPCVETEHGKGSPDGVEGRNRFRSPSHSASQGQWESEMAPNPTPGHDGLPPWHGDEYLECSARVQGSPCPELSLSHERAGRPEDAPRYSSCQRASATFKEQLEPMAEHCSHMNGAPPAALPRGYVDVLGAPRQEHPLDSQSPGSSTSLEGALVKDYGNYNGHHNGCAPSPSDTKSLSSEEDLRHPDSPSSSELLHYPPRVLNVGDLLWGQIKGFPRWNAKLGAGEPARLPGMPKSHQRKVEPEKLKTLTEDLEALSRAANRKGGKLNNHLEAAIQEAMCELDKMSGSVHHIPPRDGDEKPPKPKRRKISR